MVIVLWNILFACSRPLMNMAVIKEVLDGIYIFNFSFNLSTGKAHRSRHKHSLADMSYGKAESYHPAPRDFNSLIQTCSNNIQKITQNSKCFTAMSVVSVCHSVIRTEIMSKCGYSLIQGHWAKGQGMGMLCQPAVCHTVLNLLIFCRQRRILICNVGFLPSFYFVL